MRYAVFSDSNNPVLSIHSIGYAKSPAVTRFGPSRRNQFIIHYCLSGKGYFNGHPVTGGQGFLITPNMEEEYHPDEEDPWEFLWIISYDEKIREIFLQYNADLSTHIFQHPNTSLLKDTAAWLMVHSNSIFDSFHMLTIFLSFLKMQTQSIQDNDHKSPKLTYLGAATNYIQTNLHHPISVKELTGFLGISQPYLFHIFKENLLCSPKQYIANAKLDHAKKLLLETDFSITQIASAVGFEDVLNFSKFFSSRIGMSPKNFRKQRFY